MEYAAQYKRKLTTPEKAVADIRSEGLVAPGLVLSEPPALLEALARRLQSGDLSRLRVLTGLPQKHMLDTLLSPSLCDCVEVISQFVSSGERGLVDVGLNYYLPGHFHQVPRLIRDHMQIEASLIVVSPMDRAGYFSLGAGNDYTSTAAKTARRLIVEVNEHMPRVFGDSLLHISEVDAVVENTRPFDPLPEAPSHPEDEIIGRTVAEMVPDGATLQLGIGGLPNACAEFLMDRKDMGIHTEVFVPAMARLIEAGAVNGSLKSLHRRRHLFTLALGNQDVLDLMNDNPAFESYPVSYVNHPAVIAQNDNMVSVNSILEMDLLGQCNSEFLAGRQFSGTGGQLDYVRGAYDAKNGKSILAFHATAHGGTVSRIVPRLEEGAMVTTPRMDTHYVVTEYGAANLKGKDTRQRALAVIELAHPDFRDDLLKEADRMALL